MTTSASYARQEATTIVCTAGEDLGNDGLIELVHGVESDQLLLLLSGPNREPLIQQTIEVAGKLYKPVILPIGVAGHLHLPKKAVVCRSGGVLFEMLLRFFCDEAALPEQDSILLSGFVVATHFADCLREIPSIGIIADGESSELPLLRILGGVCRHALSLSGFRSDALQKLPPKLNPTLILTQVGRRTTVIDCLRAFQTAGFAWLGGGGLADNRCPTVILLDENSHDDLLCLPWATIDAATYEERPQLCFDERAVSAVADRFQPLLLDYRVKNRQAVGKSDFDVPRFAGGPRRLARALGRCFCNDPKVQERIMGALEDRDAAARTFRGWNIESVILEALLVLCHENKSETTPGEVCKLVNAILVKRGEVIQLTPRKIGRVLRKLNLPATRRSAGYGFTLLRDAHLAIHERARMLDVPSMHNPLPGCEFCQAGTTRNQT